MWISNNDAIIEEIPEDLKSISNTKQVEVEPNTELYSVLRLQWTVTDVSLKVTSSQETASERHLDYQWTTLGQRSGAW